ncbi:proteoglycan 4b [Nothobranchius furzeri]|uniref:Proteoglycan 4b n=2 Tax=Nothobranchius furzeri TaxID=105023 RepID=A0A8C6LPF6_NOTFU|nr:transcript variant X2 [Nothobranchius furzeri]
MCFQLFVANPEVWTAGPSLHPMRSSHSQLEEVHRLTAGSGSVTSLKAERVTDSSERSSDQVYHAMARKLICAVVLLTCALKFGSSQTSCRGRCGAEYYRGHMCQCDYTCLAYDECCKDYESQCTTKNSCQGRCGETFRRGRSCSCDSECANFKQCCPDYAAHCDADESTLTEATEEPLFSEGNDADSILNLPDIPMPSLPDDANDDVFGKVTPDEDFSNDGVKDQEISPAPEYSSGNGPSTADLLLDEIPTTATLDGDTPVFTTARAFSQTEVAPSGDPVTLHPTAGETTADPGDPTNSSDEYPTVPQPTPTVGPNDKLPTSTSGPQAEPTTSSSVTETKTTTPPFDQDSTTVLENSQITSAAPEELTSIPNTQNYPENVTSSLADPNGPATVSPTDAETPTSTAPVQNENTDYATPERTTADPSSVTSKPTDPQTSEPTSKPQGEDDLSKLTPSSKPDPKPLDPQMLTIANPGDYQSDDRNDLNLCSGRPVSGVTTLRNGTVVVFRGHYFWFLDQHHVPSAPRAITQTWRVPSPIDTVFTRCNCQGKTYIFKGGKYWRFENDVLDAGYPKLVKTGFDGLQGHITAALSVPEYRSRKESVYFFKRGGFVQKYSYQFGTSSTCDKKVHQPIYTVRARKVRQAVSVLEPAINIRKSWRGFPPTITAAVSVPSIREPEGYKYVVFSRSTTYNVRMDGERPVVAAPQPNGTPQTNAFFKCPKSV